MSWLSCSREKDADSNLIIQSSRIQQKITMHKPCVFIGLKYVIICFLTFHTSAKFLTSLKSQKIYTVKNKPCYTSSFRVHEIVKIGLGEKLTHLPSVIFAKISRCEMCANVMLTWCRAHTAWAARDIDTWTLMLLTPDLKPPCLHRVDKSHCPTPWGNVFFGRACCFILHMDIQVKINVCQFIWKSNCQPLH